MKFTLEINMDNAAFEDPFAQEELSRILRKLGKRLPELDGESGNVKDINGNTVGKWEVVES